MKPLVLNILLIIIGIIIINDSCENGKSSLATNQCIKGMFIGYYCDGLVIKILDESDIGKSWRATYGTEVYENSVVASIDSIYIKSVPKVDQYFTQGSIFYFQYINGGYPRKQFNICDPSPFITITLLSSTPCPNNK
jgi:hypothetical protein